jgi:AcrR family transcriptional regulator
MTLTPWGNTSELRSRKLRPGSGIPREQVVQNQRERLFGATVATVAEKGYEGTTIADLVNASGVSRSDFYEHFAGKKECFLAMLEAMVEPALGTINRVHARGGEQRTKEVFELVTALVASQPAAARVCFVELYAAGPEAEAVVDQAFDVFEMMALQGARETSRRKGVPAGMITAIVGGLRKIVHTRLYRGEDQALLAMTEQLWEWANTYESPPEPLRSPHRPPDEARHFGGYTPVERIIGAVAEVIAEKGYQAMSSGDVAERASISLSTFYAHFADKEDAVVAARERSEAQLMASLGPAVRRAPDWKLGVRVGFEALLAYFAAEPAFARLTMVSVYAAGPRALVQRDRMIGSLVERLAGAAYAEFPEAPAIAAEAIGEGIYALISDQVRRDGPGNLADLAALATYLTLTPFIGAEQATVIANGDGRRG